MMAVKKQPKNKFKRNISDCLSPCGHSTKSKGIKILDSENLSGGKIAYE